MPFMTPSPQKKAMDRRQLIKPSTHIPWSVDVVSVVPKVLVDKLQSQEITASASCPGWACVSTGDGMVWIWRNRTSTQSDATIEPPKPLKIFLPDIMNNADGGHPPQLALTGDGESVHLYVLFREWLFLRKLTQKDWTTRQVGARSYTAKLRIALEDEDSGSMDPEILTTLAATPTGNAASLMVILGSNKGNLYWVTHTAVPVGMQLQKIAPPSSGLWNRLIGSSPTPHEESDQDQWVLPLDASQFWVISTSKLTLWKVDRTSAPPTFEIVQQLENWNSLEFRVESLLEATLLMPSREMDQQNATMHCIVRGTGGRRSSSSDGSKLYWLQVNLHTAKVEKSHWLSRFASPDNVGSLGLACTPNGDAYAAFHASGTIIVMVLLGDDILQEVDLPYNQVPMLVPNMFQSDTVTHGCNMVASSGIGLRARYLSSSPSSSSMMTTSPSKKRARHYASSATNVNLLVNHLRSFFWQSYQDPTSVSIHNMPPSLQQASQDELEAATVQFGYELQQKGDTSSANNPMEWHKAYCSLLQQGGLYRSLSPAVRWQLLGMGQELAVFGQLARIPLANPSSGAVSMDTNSSVDALRPYDIGQWLINLYQMDPSSKNYTESEWNELLTIALETAIDYRHEMASPIYDIVVPTDDMEALGRKIPEVPLWTSQPALQALLKLQLEEWKRSNAKSEEGGPVDLVHVEAVVKAALISYSEATQETAKKSYPQVRALALDLLRSVAKEGEDELAFELSIQYHHFRGLCQISVDHEKKLDAAAYSLDQLFGKITEVDIETGYSFAQYVLQWHTDNGLYGHAINYGRHASNDLKVLMEKDERLQKYQWIPAIRQQYYGQATESCLQFGDKSNLFNHEWSLSMAKLANKLVVKQDKKRTVAIENQLELVDAQQVLLEDSLVNNLTESELMLPEALVQLALKKLTSGTCMEDRVKFGTVALAVCAAMDDQKIASQYAATVWANCFRLDDTLWNAWTQHEDIITRESFYEDTLFGKLLEDCREEPKMADVIYSRHIEHYVLDKLDVTDANKTEICRLLRSVTAVDDDIQGQSMIVAKME
ncbi:unnamed protein product [Cylindrotheca closterium]|uniref:Nuclear pore complex protein Nup133 n=1 Tax=Cylindrotheca closterium TaxID=2856 RepID=A0AAD2JHN3_9STRA|nr:unnamed protein product [Cylindrotheca closterium]